MLAASLMALFVVPTLSLGVFAEEGEAETTAEAETTTETEKDYVIELDPQYNVPTEELLKLFPITYETPAVTDLNKKVQNRMLNGFNRWNMGYEAWEHWGKVLYHADSIYHVNGVRMTLPEYQMSQNVSLKKMDIQMGSFYNILVSEDWAAIHYYSVETNAEGNTDAYNHMQFLHFVEDGDSVKVDLCFAK